MGILGKVWDKTTDVLHKVTGIQTADERRNAQRLMSDQVKAYKEQTAITRAEVDRKRNEEVAEKRRIEEKQIRSLRRNYRGSSSGLLGSAPTTEPDMNSKLGG